MAGSSKIPSARRMTFIAVSLGASLFVSLILPMSEQVHARAESGADYDIGFPQAYREVFARDRDIPCLDLLPILRSHVTGTNERLFLAGDPHLNNRGHEIVGQLMADWFRCCVKNRKRLSRESRTRVRVPNDES